MAIIARCKTLTVSSIVDPKIRASVREVVHLEELPLKLEALYPVYGISFRDGIPWYLICTSEDDDYPTPYCSVFFDLVDSRIDQGWVLILSQSNVATPALLPDCWASDHTFLERLVDGDESSIFVFRMMKERYRQVISGVSVAGLE